MKAEAREEAILAYHEFRDKAVNQTLTLLYGEHAEAKAVAKGVLADLFDMGWNERKRAASVDSAGIVRSFVEDLGCMSPTAPPAESVEDRAKALLPQQVEGADGWTPWIEPTNRHAYMVQCCGCDLVHKFQIIPVEGTRNGQGELTDFKELTDVPVILRATVSGAEPLSKTDRAIQEEADEFDAKGDAWDAFLMRKNPVEYSDSYAGFQFGWNAAIKWMKERRND